MRKIFKLFLFFYFIILFAGCGTRRIYIKILMPAEVDTLAGIRTLAVMDFEGKKGKEIAAKYVENIIKNKFYKVVEREKLTHILKEQKLSISGILDPDKTVEIGRLLGADAFVFGNIAGYSYKDTGRVITKKYKDTKTKQEKIKYYYSAKRNAQVEISFRIASTETGEILHAASKLDKITSRSINVNFTPEKVEDYKPKSALEKIAIELIKKDIKKTIT